MTAVHDAGIAGPTQENESASQQAKGFLQRSSETLKLRDEPEKVASEKGKDAGKAATKVADKAFSLKAPDLSNLQKSGSPDVSKLESPKVQLKKAVPDNVQDAAQKVLFCLTFD